MSMTNGQNGTKPGSRPLIGISPGYAGPSENRDFAKTAEIAFCDLNYTRRIEVAGGLPLLLPPAMDLALVEQYVGLLDGLLMTGGDDVHPSQYGRDLFPHGNPIAQERDQFELPLLLEFHRTGKPVLAICRGHQVMNVALGGTLIQDIPAFVGSAHHAQKDPSWMPTHQVQLADDSRVAAIFDAKLLDVNSHHHQAIDVLAPGLRVAGWSEEGIIEVVEHEAHPYMIGVQWHPERLGGPDRLHQELFDDFIKACRDRMND